MQDFFNQIPGVNTKILEGDIVKIIKTTKSRIAIVYLRKLKKCGEPLIVVENNALFLGKRVKILGFFEYNGWKYIQVSLLRDTTKRCLFPPVFINQTFAIRRKHKQIPIIPKKRDWDIM